MNYLITSLHIPIYFCTFASKLQIVCIMNENGYTFSPAQVELLNAMAWLKTDDEVRALQHAISEFFAQRADEAMEQLWADGTWNEQKLRDLENAHYRTPYEKH